MLHVNEKEAQRLFNRLKSSQKLMQERAMKEEQEGSQKEKVLLNYMKPHSERMDQIQSELQDPKNFQPAELFLDFTKFALIIGNHVYNKTIMSDLPAVVDDLKNAKHICRMMGIAPENTFTLRDVSLEEVNAHHNWLK